LQKLNVHLSVNAVRDAMRSAAISRVLMDLKRGYVTEEQAHEEIEAIKYDFDKEEQPKEAPKK